MANERARGTVQDRVLGAVGGAMIVAAVGLLLFGGSAEDGASGSEPPPRLELVEPMAGDTISAPLRLRFTSEQPIGTQPGGWGVDGYHVHAAIDGREAMPGGADIRRESDGSYVWSIGSVPAGALSLRLFWSDAAHAPVAESGTEPVTVHVR